MKINCLLHLSLFIVLPQSTDKNIHGIPSPLWPKLGRVGVGSDVRPNEARFWLPDDLRSAERLFYWMQYQVNGFVTEQHIHSQAVGEMNAHTVQHGSLGGLYFFCLLFCFFYFASLSRYSTIHKHKSGIYKSGSRHFRKEFKSLYFSRKETVTTSKK